MAWPKTISRVTAEEYLAQERAARFKSEFFDGETFAMAGGSPMHSLIAANLIGELRNRLKGSLCLPFTSDLRLKVEATGLFTYPDVSVVCGPLQFAAGTDDTLVNPTMIVEVLSDTTEAYDRGEKFRHYRHIPALQEYLLVSQRLARVDQFRRQPPEEWVLRTTEGLEGSLVLPSLRIILELAEVYAGVEFAASAFRPPTPPQDLA